MDEKNDFRVWFDLPVWYIILFCYLRCVARGITYNNTYTSFDTLCLSIQKNTYVLANESQLCQQMACHHVV